MIPGYVPGDSSQGRRSWRVAAAARDRSTWRTPVVSERSWRVGAAAPPGPGFPRVSLHAGRTAWHVSGIPGSGSGSGAARQGPAPARRMTVGYLPAPPATVARPAGHTVHEETDRLEGFLEALRRHLSGQAEQPAAPTSFLEDLAGGPPPWHDAPVSSPPPQDDPTPADQGEVETPEIVERPEAETPSEPSEPDDRSEREHGDRERFLHIARSRLGQGVPVNQVHPPPPPFEPGETVPEPSYGNLDPDDLLATFADAVREAGGTCHIVEGEIPDTLLDRLVAELNAWDVVVSAEPEAAALGERLARRGVEVRPAVPDAAAQAGLGVTSAVAGIAATGSVVLDSRRAGGRLASLLPPVHLCLLPVDRLVATPADILRGLDDDPAELPPALVIETGPSRTGDIEQLLTLGAHGPTSLHVVVIT